MKLRLNNTGDNLPFKYSNVGYFIMNKSNLFKKSTCINNITIYRR